MREIERGRALFSGSSVVPVLSQGCWLIMHYRAYAARSITISHKRMRGGDTGGNHQDFFRVELRPQNCCKADVVDCVCECSLEISQYGESG